MLEDVDDIDIILFPEFAFAGTDGGSHLRPEVHLVWESGYGYVALPLDSTDAGDVSTAESFNRLHSIAREHQCYIWASTIGEVIDGENYNALPIFSPDGICYRIRRKCWYSTHVPIRDTTIHLDTISVKAGADIAVMTTICYENSALARLLDPVEPPAPLWLLPHGTWGAAGTPEMTYATQRWSEPEEITLLGVWAIVEDEWVRPDAVLISADIFGTEWTAMKIDNYGESRDPSAYEPLAFVQEESTYVVIDCNIPDVDDELPFRRIRKIDSSFDKLTALPKISSGPVFIHGAKSEIDIINQDGNIVKKLQPNKDFVVWDGIVKNANPPGIYKIRSGNDVEEIELIR
jgi:hypothetical protein